MFISNRKVQDVHAVIILGVDKLIVIVHHLHQEPHSLQLIIFHTQMHYGLAPQSAVVARAASGATPTNSLNTSTRPFIILLPRVEVDSIHLYHPQNTYQGSQLVVVSLFQRTLLRMPSVVAKSAANPSPWQVEAFYLKRPWAKHS